MNAPQPSKPFNRKFFLVLFIIALPFLLMIPWGERVEPLQEAVFSSKVSPYCFALSRDSRFALLGGNQEAAWLVDSQTGKVVHRFSSPTRMVCSVDLTPDGSIAAVCKADGKLSFWSVADGSEIATYSVFSKVDNPENITRYQIALTPDITNVLLCDENRGLLLLDIAEGEPTRALIERTPAEIPWFDFSPEGEFAYAYDATNSTMRGFSTTNNDSISSQLEPFACSAGLITPDCACILLSGEDGVIRVWDVETKKVVRYLRHPEPVTALNASPDGSLLYVGGSKGAITVWNLPRLQYVRTIYHHTCSIAALGELPGGSELVVYERTGMIWNWDFSLNKNVWDVSGFHFNNKQQIVSAVKGNLTFPRQNFFPISLESWTIDPSIQPTLDLKKGFTPERLEEMESNPDLRITPNELTALIVNYHARFETSQIQYEGEDRCSNLANRLKESSLSTAKQVQQLRRKVMEEKQQSELSMEAKERLARWEWITDDMLDAYIQSNERLIDGFTRRATRAYTVGSVKRFAEVLWPNDSPQRCVYFFKGDREESFVSVSNRNEKFGVDWPSRLNKSPAFPYRFGADLDWFLQCGYRIATVDWERRKILLTPIRKETDPCIYEFVLLDGHNAYWKKCDAIKSGKVVRTISCDDFIVVSGMLVPKSVSVLDREGTECVFVQLQTVDMSSIANTDTNVRIHEYTRAGNVQYEYRMNLIDAKVNQSIDKIPDVFKDKTRRSF